MKEPTILLLGCGYVLQKLTHKLHQGSYVVTRRTPQVGAVTYDLCKEAPLFLKKFPTISVIIDSIPPGENEVEHYLRFIEFLKTAEVSKVIYLSTTSVTGIDDGSVVDERTVINPKTEQGRRRVAVEEMYMRSGINFCALRLPAIYGPGRGIGHALKGGRYQLIKDSHRWTNRIHLNDLTSIIHAAISASNLPNTIYISDDKPTLQRELVEFYCKNFDLPWPKEITLEEAKGALHHTMLSNQKIKNDLMKRLMGISLQYPSYIEGAKTEF